MATVKEKVGKAAPSFQISNTSLMDLLSWRGNPSFVTIESCREDGDTAVLVLIPRVGASVSAQLAREILKALGHHDWKEDGG